MTILLAMILGLIAAAVSFVGGAFGASLIASATHMSNVESTRDYFVVSVGLCSSFLALISTIILTLRRRGITDAGGVLGGTGGAIAGIVGVAALGIGLYASSQPQSFGHGGSRPRLEFEIQPPSGASLPDLAATQAELHTGLTVTDGSWDQDGSTGSVQLDFRTPRRLLALRLPNREVQLFRLRLPSDPTGDKYRQWSDWQLADLVDGAGRTEPAPLAPEKAFKIRYQIVQPSEQQ